MKYTEGNCKNDTQNYKLIALNDQQPENKRNKLRANGHRVDLLITTTGQFITSRLNMFRSIVQIPEE